MLPGFEDITRDLTDYELKTLVPLFIRGLAKKYGKKNAITNKQIVKSLMAKGYEVSDVRVRKIINHISVTEVLPGLVASSAGYYRTNDINDLKRYEESLAGRELQIRRRRQAVRSHLNHLLTSNQLNIRYDRNNS